MYSQCPECLTRFRVTAGALRVAHGTVRCGRCGSAFDALQSLTDTVPEESGQAAAAPLETPVSAAEPTGPAGADVPEFHFSADDIEQVFVDARDWTQRFPDAREAGAGRGQADAAQGAGGAPQVYVHEPEAVEDITLEGERIVIEGLPELDDDLRQVIRDSESVDETPGTGPEEPPGADDAVRLPGGEPPPVDLDATDRFRILRAVSEAADPARAETAAVIAEAPAAIPPHVDTGRDTSTAASSPVVPFRLRQRADLDETLGTTAGGDDAIPPRRGARGLWAFGSLLLALVLLGQLAHHYRQELARDGRIGPIVRDVYARAGRALPPHWDLGAYELRQWGTNASTITDSGAMVVRASLRNAASFPQPLPLLRLELEDRFGNTVARRDFEPREYLKDPAQAGRLLPAGAATEAALDVVDTGRDAVGYRLDLCMRTDQGALQCAQSPLGDAQARR